MKRINEIFKSVKWEKQIEKMQQNFNTKHETYNEEQFWHFVISQNQIFESNQEFINFLADFWFNLNTKYIPANIINEIYKIKKQESLTNEDMFYFFANSIQIDFEYFNVLILKYNFLFKNIKNLTDEQFIIFDKFWTAIFFQKDIPITFLNRYYPFFATNIKYFKNKLCSNKSFFKLDQFIINKIKAL